MLLLILLKNKNSCIDLMNQVEIIRDYKNLELERIIEFNNQVFEIQEINNEKEFERIEKNIKMINQKILKNIIMINSIKSENNV